MDATRAEVERELEGMYCRLMGVWLQIASRRDDIAKFAGGRYFSSDDFAGALHRLKLSEEEEHQYLYAIKVLRRILERTQPPAIEWGE